MTTKDRVWAAVVVAALLCAGLWMHEHDARIRAEEAVKTAQTNIAALQSQVQASAQVTAATVTAIQKKAAKVTTPAQAIAAIPDISDVPLNARPLPDMPTAVAVEAVPLYQELASCRVTEAKLDGCAAAAALTAKIIVQKDAEIAALKKPNSFWHRAKEIAEAVAIGAAVGYIAHGR